MYNATRDDLATALTHLDMAIQDLAEKGVSKTAVNEQLALFWRHRLDELRDFIEATRRR